MMKETGYALSLHFALQLAKNVILARDDATLHRGPYFFDTFGVLILRA
jgi:hypothetical protein